MFEKLRASYYLSHITWLLVVLRAVNFTGYRPKWKRLLLTALNDLKIVRHCLKGAALFSYYYLLTLQGE